MSKSHEAATPPSTGGASARLSRRNLLGFLSTMGVSVYLGGCEDVDSPYANAAVRDPDGDPNAPRSGRQAHPGSPKKVVVLGGGLSGLAAAWELTKLGHNVTVLEAQPRVGGRVRSWRTGALNNQVGEFGAVRIPDVHEHTLGYVQELGLALESFSHGDALYVTKGQRFMQPQAGGWPLNFTAAEQQEGMDMWNDYVAAWFDGAGDPRDGSFPSASLLAQWDNASWVEWLAARGASPDWIAAYACENGSEVPAIGALAWFAQEVADQAWTETFHVKGGNDLLPRGLAQLLGSKVQLGCKVTKIITSSDDVAVTYVQGGKTRVVEADHVVCALPFTILRDIPLSPALPVDKARCIRELNMMVASRVVYQTSNRFWQNEGMGGLKIAKTDTAAERLWDLTNCQAGPTGIVAAYMQHNNARAMQALPFALRASTIAGVIEGFLPGFQSTIVHTESVCWGEDPYVKGAWCDILPGQWWMMSVAGRAEGRLHFCGEHTSIWSGWMQGAIESGKRCAVEINQA